MKRQRYKSVWDAAEQTHGEAANMKLRSELMIAITRYIEEQELSQVAGAKALGVTQPRISDLMRGKIDLFSVDTLINMAAAAGFRVDIQLKRKSKRAA